MSINKLALLRYKAIDNCLQNRFRKWTLNDLVEACADAVYDYEGITSGVSKRTVQLDIQNMRSSKLGYNAPIVVIDKKFYTYEDKTYSITNSPINSRDAESIQHAVNVLKQFSGFGFFNELSEIVTKLESKVLIQSGKNQAAIDFEKNSQLKGLQYIEPLHHAIINKQPVCILYQSFKAREASEAITHPYLLKEYRNRWFLLATTHHNNNLVNFALDRIKSISTADNIKFIKPSFNVHTFYDNLIGVTKDINQPTIHVVFKLDATHAPYVVTKPLHHTQQIISTDKTGTTFSIDVVQNYELERELLGFGEHLTVISPNTLRRKIRYIIKKMHGLYFNTKQQSSN